MQGDTIVQIAVVAIGILALVRVFGPGARAQRLPPLGEGGRHSPRELQRIVRKMILPAFASDPRMDRLEYAAGGLLGRRDLPVIQRTLGRGYDAYFRPDAPGVLVVDRRQR